jgi:hypothetical protein
MLVLVGGSCYHAFNKVERLKPSCTDRILAQRQRAETCNYSIGLSMSNVTVDLCGRKDKVDSSQPQNGPVKMHHVCIEDSR